VKGNWQMKEDQHHYSINRLSLQLACVNKDASFSWCTWWFDGA
jgi:hypothetical protein